MTVGDEKPAAQAHAAGQADIAGRRVVITGAGRGLGAEIAALAVYQGFWTLDAPVMRVAPPPTPSPYAPNLERHWLPDRQSIERAAAELVRI